MSKVITFSRNFPSYHPKAGQPTYFVEKFLSAVYNPIGEWYLKYLIELNPQLKPEKLKEFYDSLVIANFEPKWHTIRAGFRFEKGEYFSPRVWSGQPYNSKQIIFATDQQVNNTWAIEKTPLDGFMVPKAQVTTTLTPIAKNDGLELQDFKDWFPKPFIGQIICWNKNINY